MPPAECSPERGREMNDAARKVLEKLQAQCARREYCSSDILAKARQKLDGDEASAAEILESLTGDGFVDDLRYAAAFAREKSSLTGWGPIKIKFALRAKRISAENIAAALLEVEPEKADSRLEKLLTAKKKTLEGDPQARLKLLKFALTRGYEYDSVTSVLENIDRGVDR